VTVIAWDGRTLAADRRATSGGAILSVTKLFRTDDGEYIVAVSGGADSIEQTRAWFNAGRDPKEWHGDNEGSCHALAIHRSGRIEKYESSGFPMIIEDPFAASGSGRDYARAVLHMGHRAWDAVAVACALDTECGNGIDTLQHD